MHRDDLAVACLMLGVLLLTLAAIGAAGTMMVNMIVWSVW